MAVRSHSFEPTVDHALALREAFGRFGTGVTVVTAQTPNGPLGMTANSFSSISLDPALVLWAPARSSLRHDAFVAAERFCIHVLAVDQLELARHFATNGTEFGSFEWDTGPLDAPCLSGCLVEFHCTTFAVHPAGDHSIILGKVEIVTQHDRKQPGLLFEQGQFGSIMPNAANPQ
ncbi:MAG: flavin reductase family protein [Pseudomonadota bacterium]